VAAVATVAGFFVVMNGDAGRAPAALPGAGELGSFF
jgi:hypothetical protein